ncbi:MAG: hypothetical protein AAF791_10285 [Bacteroidota bacterium]
MTPRAPLSSRRGLWRGLASVLLLASLAGCARPLATSGDPASGLSPEACYDFSPLAASDRATADSILAYGLDHEGLYTLAAGLKPISTLHQESFPLARPDSIPAGVRDAAPDGFAHAADRLARLYRVADALRCGSVQAVVVPFRRPFEGQKTLQVVAVDRQRLDGILARDARFWSALGITPGADPSLVVSVVEHAQAYDRWRGYGYLFGYPEAAITFFVEAGREADSTGQFVSRDFISAPVYARETGHFTWAVPQGHVLTEADSLRLGAAADLLGAYRLRRPAYLRADSTVRAADLLRDWAREPRRTYDF